MLLPALYKVIPETENVPVPVIGPGKLGPVELGALLFVAWLDSVKLPQLFSTVFS